MTAAKSQLDGVLLRHTQKDNCEPSQLHEQSLHDLLNPHHWRKIARLSATENGLVSTCSSCAGGHCTHSVHLVNTDGASLPIGKENELLKSRPDSSVTSHSFARNVEPPHLPIIEHGAVAGFEVIHHDLTAATATTSTTTIHKYTETARDIKSPDDYLRRNSREVDLDHQFPAREPVQHLSAPTKKEPDLRCKPPSVNLELHQDLLLTAHLSQPFCTKENQIRASDPPRVGITAVNHNASDNEHSRHAEEVRDSSTEKHSLRSVERTVLPTSPQTHIDIVQPIALESNHRRTPTATVFPIANPINHSSPHLHLPVLEMIALEPGPVLANILSNIPAHPQLHSQPHHLAPDAVSLEAPAIYSNICSHLQLDGQFNSQNHLQASIPSNHKICDDSTEPQPYPRTMPSELATQKTSSNGATDGEIAAKQKSNSTATYKEIDRASTKEVKVDLASAIISSYRLVTEMFPPKISHPEEARVQHCHDSKRIHQNGATLDHGKAQLQPADEPSLKRDDVAPVSMNNQQTTRVSTDVVTPISVSQSPPSTTDKVRPPSPETSPVSSRYLLGTEIALAAVIAAAGVARVRTIGTKPAASDASLSEKSSVDQTQLAPRSMLDGYNPPAHPVTSTTGRVRSEEHDPHLHQTAATGDHKAVQSDPPFSSGAIQPVIPEGPSPLEVTLVNETGQTSDPIIVVDHNTKEKDSMAQPAAQAPRLRPKTLVSPRDTLVSIAESFFHDPNIAWLIADLNRDRIKESWIDEKRIVEIRSRQQIDLPVWDDIDEFYRSNPLPHAQAM